MNHELAKTLTLALVNYLDDNRPEGTMDCSSAECERVEKAFEVNNLDFVEGFMEKKLSRLTEFETSLRQIIEKTLSGETPNGSGGTMSWAVALTDDDIKKLAPKVLALAYKEILAFIDSLPEDHFRDSTKMISKELEEAADNHIRKIVDAAGHPGWDWTSRDIKDAFIAGAEWQKSQMPMPEDTVIFMKGVAEGRRLEREDREENKRKEDELPRFYGD